MKITRTVVNYVVDMLMLVTFLIVSITGVIKYLFLYPLMGQYSRISFMGMSKYDMSVLHDVSGMLMLFFVALHLVLHARWIYCMTKSIFLKKEKTCD